MKEHNENRKDDGDDDAPSVGTILNKGGISGAGAKEESTFLAFGGKGVTFGD